MPCFPCLYICLLKIPRFRLQFFFSWFHFRACARNNIISDRCYELYCINAWFVENRLVLRLFVAEEWSCSFSTTSAPAGGQRSRTHERASVLYTRPETLIQMFFYLASLMTSDNNLFWSKSDIHYALIHAVLWPIRMCKHHLYLE